MQSNINPIWAYAESVQKLYGNGRVGLRRQKWKAKVCIQEQRQLAKVTFIGCRKWHYTKKKEIVDLWFKVGLGAYNSTPTKTLEREEERRERE